MRLLLTLALLLLWFRFFDSHVKAYIYVMYLEILSKYGSTYVFAYVFGTLIRSGMVKIVFRRVGPLIDRTITDSELIKLSTRI